jgi:hypothetical protein
LIIVAAWLLGVAWILIPHRGEGPVELVLSDRYGLGVHRTDFLGLIVPAIVTVIVARGGRRTHGDGR